MPKRWNDVNGTIPPLAGAVRILVVDHDIRSTESLASMLRAGGYAEVQVAYSGHAALEIATSFRPNVVLLEIELLDMGGCELAQLLRERAQSDKLRLIAMTFRREHGDRESARAAGFERYLLKPVAAVELKSLMDAQPR